MMELLRALFSNDGFMPHGHCYFWTPGLVWLQVISDALIVIAYYSIPFGLFRFARQRRDVDFRWMFVCFGVFIFACGTTHLMEIWNVWHSWYWLAGLIKAITAAASIFTALWLLRLLPLAIALPSPSAMRRANETLEREIQQRRAAEERVQALNADLEARVENRTAELHAANEALQAQIQQRERSELAQAQLAAIVESSSDAIIGEDLDAMVTSWNSGAERMFGYSAAEMLGRSITQILRPNYAEDEERILFRIRRGEIVEHFETVRVRKDGTLIDVSVTVSAIKDAPGQVVGASNVVRNITERKRADAERAQLAQLIEHSRDFIAMADLEGRLTFLNRGGRRMIGMTPEQDMHALNFTDYVPPQWQEFFRKTVISTVRDQGVWEGEMQLCHLQTGALLDVLRSTFLLRDDAGNPTAFATVTRDITGQNQAVRALRESEERLHAVTENLSEGLVIADMEGHLFHWNRACLELHGFQDLQEGQRKLPDFTDNFELRTLDGRILPVEEWPLARVLRGEQLREFEGRIRRLDRAWERIFSFSGRIVQGSATQPLAFLAISDITERREAEDALAQLNADLENRVNHRTEQLQAANKELEAFSYSVSHDLRAPLRAIDGFSKAVIEDYGDLLPAPGQRYLATVRGGAQRMGRLIDDLLTFSRLSRLPLRTQPVNMENLVALVLEELEPETRGRRLDLRIAPLPPCEGDPALLKQVWMNLLSNAFKYTRKREEAVVEITGQDEGPLATYHVRDNGSGFDMRYAGKLFGVFQRLHRAEEFEGTGVGLAIVQRVIHRHGGTVSATAVPEAGATFTFTLGSGKKS